MAAQTTGPKLGFPLSYNRPANIGAKVRAFFQNPRAPLPFLTQ